MDLNRKFYPQSKNLSPFWHLFTTSRAATSRVFNKDQFLVVDVPHATITASRSTSVAGMRSAWDASIYMKLLMGAGDSPRHGLQIGKEILPLEKE